MANTNEMQNQQTNSIQMVDSELASEDDSKTTESTSVTFYYAFDHAVDCEETPVISVLENEQIQDKPCLPKLQKKCPELADIYKYLESDILPQNRKQ